jgi:hypothetical protein
MGHTMTIVASLPGDGSRTTDLVLDGCHPFETTAAGSLGHRGITDDWWCGHEIMCPAAASPNWRVSLIVGWLYLGAPPFLRPQWLEVGCPGLTGMGGESLCVSCRPLVLAVRQSGASSFRRATGKTSCDDALGIGAAILGEVETVLVRRAAGQAIELQRCELRSRRSPNRTRFAMSTEGGRQHDKRIG